MYLLSDANNVEHAGVHELSVDQHIVIEAGMFLRVRLDTAHVPLWEKIYIYIYISIKKAIDRF